MKNTILEIITTRRNQPTRKHQYCSRSDGSGYWHLIYEWVDGSWQIVSRDPLDEIEIDISNSRSDCTPTPLVECPVCGRTGLPERIAQHNCTPRSTQ